MAKHNKSINDLYNNKLSHLYINTVNHGNATPEESMTLMAHDLQFENHRNHLVGPYNLTDHTNNPLLNNKTLNLVKADEYNRKQAKKAVWNILSVIHDSITTQPQVLVFLVKPEKTRHTISLTKRGISRNFERIQRSKKWDWHFLEYSRMLSYRPKLLRTFRELGLTALLANIESVQYYLYLYVHMQGLLLVKQRVSVTNLEHQLKAKTGKDIKLKPLRQPEKVNNNLGTFHYGNPVVYNSKSFRIDRFAPKGPKVEPAAEFDYFNDKAIIRFVYYMYKQYKLPVAYGNDTRAKRAFNRFAKLSQSEKLALIEAIQNSSYRKQLHYHISYKQWKRNHQPEPEAETRPLSNPDHATQIANTVFDSFITEAQSKANKDTQSNTEKSTDGNFRANESVSKNEDYRDYRTEITKRSVRSRSISANNLNALLPRLTSAGGFDVHESALCTNQAPIFFTEPVALQRKWKPLKPT